MSAKITLIGQPQSLRIERDLVTFKIVTGPASNSAPKGLDLYKAVTYVVHCNKRQISRGRVDERDKSELIIEGYQEPRTDADGKLYIDVVALAISSKQLQGNRKVEQLRDETLKAEEAYERACDKYGLDSAEAQSAAEAFEKIKGNYLKFMGSQPK